MHLQCYCTLSTLILSHVCHPGALCGTLMAHSIASCTVLAFLCLPGAFRRIPWRLLGGCGEWLAVRKLSLLTRSRSDQAETKQNEK